MLIRLDGRCRVRLEGTDTQAVLNRCGAASIDISNAEKEGEYALTLEICESDVRELESITKRCMCDFEILEIKGGSAFLTFIKSHLVFAAAVITAICLVFCSSLFIWEIRVYGNEKLTDGEILRVLSECGVDTGTYRPGLKNELIRSKMLLALPELAWMSVNVSGSRATVLVSERIEKPEIYDASEYTDIVSKTDGIVKSVRALNGTALVGRGQSVLKGETLIDGRIESITAPTRYVHALGSIIAQTSHEDSAVRPLNVCRKTGYRGAKNRFAIKTGKLRINFYLNGGNTVDECDKIIHNHKVGIKNVFSLPVTVVHERLLAYKTETISDAHSEEMAERLSDRLEKELDGEVLSQSVSEHSDGELLTVTLRSECLENIAELIKKDTDHDRTDDKG